MKRNVWLLGAIVVIAVALAGCGKSNIFAWAHKSGDTGNLDSLSSDASSALQEKDFTKALEYYTKLLDADPNNAEAIYGYAVAKLADSGLDVGDLIANLVKQQSSPEYRRLAPAVASITKQSSVNATNLLPQNIIDNIVRMKAAVNDVLSPSKLPKIVKGTADARISPKSTDVNINVAFCLILRAAMTVEDSGLVTFDTDYNMTVNTNSTALSTVIRSALKDIASANARFKVIVANLKLANDNSIVNIQDDIKALFDDAKAKVSAAPYNVDCSDIDVNTDYL